MILVWGSAGDPPTKRVIDCLQHRGVEMVHIDDLADVRYDVAIKAGVSGWIGRGDDRVAVDDIGGMYVRPGESQGRSATRAASSLLALASTIDANVVNRPDAGRSNWSKPFQLGLIAAAGLDVPDTLVTTDPDAARDFLAAHGRLVYKSVSGVRSIVSIIEPHDAARLDGVRTGPVQLQRWIDGLDVRVHVVGSRWFACSAASDAADYRYAAMNDQHVQIEPFVIPADLGQQLVDLTRQLGLAVSGIDLRLTKDGRWVCFEANPSPGFSFYEDATGQPIADAICDLLTGVAF